MKQEVCCIDACEVCAWLGCLKTNLEEHQKSQHGESCYKSCICWRLKQLSKPKLNQNLSSTEFEVRLHSYSDIHHPPPPTTRNYTPGKQGRDNCTTVQSLPVQPLSTDSTRDVQTGIDCLFVTSTVFLWLVPQQNNSSQKLRKSKGFLHHGELTYFWRMWRSSK